MVLPATRIYAPLERTTGLVMYLQVAVACNEQTRARGCSEAMVADSDGRVDAEAGMPGLLNPCLLIFLLLLLCILMLVCKRVMTGLQWSAQGSWPG